MNPKLIAELLHPVRMRIVQELSAADTATARQLALALPDVAQASLYRHLKALVQDSILEICSEVPVRGTLERTYRLSHNPLRELDEQGAKLPNSQLLNLFYSFMLSQLRDCASYLGEENLAVETDRFGFRSWLLNFDDENLARFIADFASLLQRYSQLEASAETRVHKFSFTLFPGSRN